MKNIMLKAIAIFILLISYSIPNYALSLFYQPPVYIPIDSLSREHLYYDVIPNFKDSVFSYEIEGQTFSFSLKPERNIQHYSSIVTDTIMGRDVYYYNHSMITRFDQESEIYLTFNKLLSFTEDSIYVSAHYTKFSIEKGCYLCNYNKIKSIAIGRKDLSGVLLLHYPEGFKTGQSYLTGGYSIIRGGKNNTTNHIIDIGLAKTTFHAYNFITSSVYLSNEFAFNKEKFFIGPKIGGQVSLFAFGLGSEIIYYTDFHDSSVQWLPYFFIGMANYKLHFGKRVALYNKNFQNNMNSFAVGISIPVVPLSKRKVKL